MNALSENSESVKASPENLPKNAPAQKGCLANVDRVVMLLNAHAHLRKKYRKVPLWAFVSDITGHGSGYSCDIAREQGWDPHQDGDIELPWAPQKKAADQNEVLVRWRPASELPTVVDLGGCCGKEILVAGRMGSGLKFALTMQDVVAGRVESLFAQCGVEWWMPLLEPPSGKKAAGADVGAGVGGCDGGGR